MLATLASFVVRQFRQAVQTTHQDSTDAVAAIARAHQAMSTEMMQSGWVRLSTQHVDEILGGCTVLADALDVAAGYIVAQKAEAVGVLIGMAAAFFADQAAAVVTLGLSEAVVPLIIEGAEELVKSLVMMAGLDWSKSGATAGKATGFSLAPAAVRSQTQVLRENTAAIRAHAAAFQGGVRGLNF
jgi:hypothetical protein